MRLFSRLTGLLAMIMMLLPGCRIQYVPVKETEYVTVRDSVYLRDTTVQYKIEKEYVRDYTGLLDTLELSTGMAEAKAWVDTSKAVLAGSIKNKENVINVPASVKEKVVYKDRIVTKEIPVEVEKIVKTHYPYEKYLWGWTVLSLALLMLFAYMKVKKIW